MIYYDREIDPVDSAEDAPAAEPPSADVTEETDFSVIAKIVGDQQGEPIMVSALRQLVEVRIPNFDDVQKRMGYARFRDLSRAAERAGHIALEIKGMVQWARSANLDPSPIERRESAAPPEFNAGPPSEERLRMIILFMDQLERSRPYITFGYLLERILREPWVIQGKYERRDMQELLDAAVNDYGMFIKGSYERYDEFQRRQVDIPMLALDRQSQRVKQYLLKGSISIISI